MNETFKHKRKLSLITLEGLRDFVESKTPFEHKFVLVGFSARGTPHYQMLVEAEGENYVFVSSRVSKSGANIRLLNLELGVVSMHREFGKGKLLRVYIDKENACEPHVL